MFESSVPTTRAVDPPRYTVPVDGGMDTEGELSVDELEQVVGGLARIWRDEPLPALPPSAVDRAIEDVDEF